MRTMIGRIAVAVVLLLLGLGHLAFGFANFRYVESLPVNLDVLIEGLAALTAAGALIWSAVRHVRGRRWARLTLAGGGVFAVAMVLSVSTGASTPSMFQVVVPVLLVGGLAWLWEARADRRRATTATEHGDPHPDPHPHPQDAP